MPEIVISEFMDMEAINYLKKDFDVLYDPNLVDDNKLLIRNIKGAKALIVRNRTQVFGELLNSASMLACIGRLGVGLDNIDLVECEKRDIKVFPAIGANNRSVAEYVITSAMILLRKAYFSKSEMINGLWPRQECSGREINDKVLGLIGFGQIARETAKLAIGLGLKVIAYDPFLPFESNVWVNVEKLDLDSVLKRSDIVSLHIPLNEQTKHLISGTRLKLMQSSGILINAARGGVVDENALVEALLKGELAGAAIDVFESEPLSDTNASKFKNIDNLLITPHIAGLTSESNTRVSFLTAQTVAEFIAK